MSARDEALRTQLAQAMQDYEIANGVLRGIRRPVRRQVLIEQLVESIHRIDFVRVVRGRHISPLRSDPTSDLFDPLRAAILAERSGQIDEAFWFVFLFVHFGKNNKGGWRYAREVYGRLGSPPYWSWSAVSQDVPGFRTWLEANEDAIRRPGVPGGFSNHRKYQSLDARSPNGTGAAVATYVAWIGPPRTHAQFIEQVCRGVLNDPRKAFRELYTSMGSVRSFGRTARFDYLAMLGKLGLAPILPDATYLTSSTGPVKGARLLIGGAETASIGARELEEILARIDEKLQVGMQVLEDALCNWQKSPDAFKPFRG